MSNPDLTINTFRGLPYHQRKGSLEIQLSQIRLRKKRLADGGQWAQFDFWAQQESSLVQVLEQLTLGAPPIGGRR